MDRLDDITTVRNAVMKLHRSIVEIKLNAEFVEEYGLSNGARSRKLGRGEGAIGPLT